ncbi:MAG TPA: hypothetical protein VGG99_16015 [Acetobacteraceae bacterium]|jgi:hypothetical protein
MSHIAVINESSKISDADVRKMLPAFNQQWNQDLRPIWGTEAAKFGFVRNGHAPPAGAWWMVFLDNSDQANVLAYHDLTNEGWPIAKVFVESILSDNGSVSVAATHELCEMAVDPWVNTAYLDSHSVFWAGEICDPVEDDGYGYEIGGVLVTDFVTPDWFGHQHAGTQIDFRRHAGKAFEIMSGGYAQKFELHHGWQQVTGAKARHSKMAVHPAPGSRRERRSRQWKSPLKRSIRKWG